MLNLSSHLIDIKAQGCFGFMPFWLAGYPSVDESIQRMKMLLKYGDLLEVGIPFSDPSADGAIIQKASSDCIASGFRTEFVFDIIKRANAEYGKPVVILCYLNTILQHGVTRFMRDAEQANVSALLVPDLPPEESHLIKPDADKYGVSLIYIVSTNTAIERVISISSLSPAFLYFVSRPSVTGEAAGNVQKCSIEAINAICEAVSTPLYVGFGISSREQVDQYANTGASGFIVGSKLIATATGTIADTERLLRSLRE